MVYTSPDAVRLRPVAGREIRIPREHIARVWQFKAPDEGLLRRSLRALGLRDRPRGVLWMTGAGQKLVALEIDPPLTVRRWGIPREIHRAVVSVHDPDALIAQLLG